MSLSSGVQFKALSADQQNRDSASKGGVQLGKRVLRECNNHHKTRHLASSKYIHPFQMLEESVEVNHIEQYKRKLFTIKLEGYTTSGVIKEAQVDKYALEMHLTDLISLSIFSLFFHVMV